MFLGTEKDGENIRERCWMLAKGNNETLKTEFNGQIDLIIAGNVKDFKYCKIGVMTPENFVKTISQKSD